MFGGDGAGARERGERANPGGINSSYRNSSGLVSASVLG